MVAMMQQPRRVAPKRGIERRVFSRTETHDTVEARRLDHTLSARRDPRLSLQLRDVSAGGLSALTATPMMVGERVDVKFPSVGLRPSWAAFGRVIRIQPSEFGYRIAVEFDSLAAAA